MVECGYDLTMIDIDELEKFFKKYDLHKGPERNEELCAYVFKSYENEDIEIRMGAVPFANGLLFETRQGTRGAGYCSYIGLKGSEDFINDFKELVDEYGNAKDYSDTAEFI